MISSLISQDLNFNHRQRLWVLALLVLALLMTLIQGEWRWLAGVGWIFLAVLLTLDQHFIFYALLFFAPWFHSSGFLAHLPFSLKHFQAVFFLGLIIQTARGNLLNNFSKSLKLSKFLYPVIIIIFIGVINFFRLETPMQALRAPANLLLTLSILFYLFGVWKSFDRAKNKIIKSGISFFLVAVVVQIFIALQNTIAGTFLFSTELIHNNHIGILCSFSSFFGMGLFLSEKEGGKKNLYGVATIIIVSAMIASCSRTSWFSFLTSLACFLILAYWCPHKSNAIQIRKRHIMTIALIFAGLFFLLSLINPFIYARVLSLRQLFDFEYWKFTVGDFKNFGFLGISRLQLLFDLKVILQKEPLFGIGFTKQIVDFHGFYFCLLGATGFVGLFVFAAFVRALLTRLLTALNTDYVDGLFFLRLASFCAFLTWLLCSFLESYFVQFSAWITVFLVIILGDPIIPEKGGRGLKL